MFGDQDDKDNCTSLNIFEDILIEDKIWKQRIIEDIGDDIFEKYLECISHVKLCK